VQATTSGIDQTYTKQAEVEQICGEHLGSRFSLGKRAPLSAIALHEEIGNLSDSDAARKILENNYDFAEHWDPATVDLLRASARLRLECEDPTTSGCDVTVEEFTDFWATCKEVTSSSKSGRHFGHYRAMCDDKALTLLQVHSINLAARCGAPLTRWRQGVTVLLEKVSGNIRIDKLRAICLLEADFNWWLKVVFAKRMTQRMKKTGVLPLEQGATSGKTALDSSMTKQLFFDQANILHTICAVSSNDAANCYDAINHAAGSFALQAMNVRISLIKCYLLCVQTMQFFLKTGFGLATQGYGGSSQNPYMGLIQGSGAAPAAWTAISTLMLAAYKSKGYGALFASAWSGVVLSIAALLYVDDTDLLHTCPTDITTEYEFFSRVQTATHYWATLLQATGGNLKPEKCYWYLLSYKFVQGRALLKPLREINHFQLKLPQPQSEDVIIQLKDPTEASEVLGVWTSLTSSGITQLKHMISKGQKWGNRVLHSPLQPAEVWHSFKTQALPSVKYGLLPLMSSRQEVDKTFSSWYYSLLPALGVNRNIAKAWRTLPQQYQGLGLPQMSLEKLAVSLHYLQRHWGTQQSTGKFLRCVFELCQLETGLAGNFLNRDYNTYGCLATHSWFKVLWEYMQYYGTKIDLEDVTIAPVRERDKVIMEEATLLLPQEQ
jgi:hypothetical protein